MTVVSLLATMIVGTLLATAMFRCLGRRRLAGPDLRRDVGHPHPDTLLVHACGRSIAACSRCSRSASRSSSCFTSSSPSSRTPATSRRRPSSRPPLQCARVARPRRRSRSWPHRLQRAGDLRHARPRFPSRAGARVVPDRAHAVLGPLRRGLRRPRAVRRARCRPRGVRLVAASRSGPDWPPTRSCPAASRRSSSSCRRSGGPSPGRWPARPGSGSARSSGRPRRSCSSARSSSASRTRPGASAHRGPRSPGHRGVLGLPPVAGIALVLAFLRKELALQLLVVLADRRVRRERDGPGDLHERRSALRLRGRHRDLHPLHRDARQPRRRVRSADGAGRRAGRRRPRARDGCCRRPSRGVA